MIPQRFSGLNDAFRFSYCLASGANPSGHKGVGCGGLSTPPRKLPCACRGWAAPSAFLIV